MPAGAECGTALVLAGGGSFGAVQVGMLKALVDHMQYQSEHYRGWAVARWKVDGSPVTGPILNLPMAG